ncbi:MAG TPA: HD domain-containing phosphohydrolase [Blastocatellia bacterium]|nr:HD domain-containing phosphohydrolase [Blastocatellia bacterium]
MSLEVRRMMHTLNSLAELGEEVSSAHDFDEMMRASLYTMLGTLAIRKGAIARVSENPSQLKVVAAKGLRDALKWRIGLERDEAGKLAAHPGIIDVKAEQNGLAHFVERNFESLQRLKTRCIAPMIVRGELMGAIFLSEKFSGETYSEDEMEVLKTISRHVGVAIHNHKLLISAKRRAEENRRLYREMRNTYQNTIRAFAAAIDLKDAYTKGHSDRVARYSEAIARQMGVSGPELEFISVAGYLHDIGKIIVDRSIINSPRPLTEPEFKELNTHVLTGYEILSNISSPWNKIAYMTKCHHERYDGSGYPQGLRGEEIPLGSRIVTLADSYDAMMTDRPYRSKLPLERALEEIRKNTGRQFSPDVVVAFCELILKELDREKPRVVTAAAMRNFHSTSTRETIEVMLKEITRLPGCPTP